MVRNGESPVSQLLPQGRYRNLSGEILISSVAKSQLNLELGCSSGCILFIASAVAPV